MPEQDRDLFAEGQEADVEGDQRASADGAGVAQQEAEQNELEAEFEIEQADMEPVHAPPPAPRDRQMALQQEASVERLMVAAIERGNVDVMERVMAVRRELMREEAKREYFRALAEFQSRCPIIQKTQKVYNRDGTLRYRYAPLPQIVMAVRGLLEELGFSYVIRTKVEQAMVSSTCVAHHAGGWEEETTVTAPVDQQAHMNAPQKVASAITFTSRYAFRNAFGILTGETDDDSGSNVEEQQLGVTTKVVADMTEEEKAAIPGRVRELANSMYRSIRAAQKNEWLGEAEAEEWWRRAQLNLNSYAELRRTDEALGRLLAQRQADTEGETDGTESNGR